ncbi:hypothetical protein FT643_17495 [Ketobacter sp. MCCC 1A13808]|uniref:hypothetical protein n=1 Tax=Ketobacter sp. MCCC 1A13808 TaxID=2602738 RepID=UPI0012ECB7C7|nr:hypothetical protein [Ketobacter sp. MCCC 1A13808]MVF13937.1 hypothetical protein [Ketobacter sp. MCCC 1A13808]
MVIHHILIMGNVLCYLAIVLIIRSSVYGYLAKSALNPVFVLATFSMINAILFYANFDIDWVQHPRITFYTNLSDRAAAFSIFTAYNVALTAGVAFDYFLKRKNCCKPVEMKEPCLRSEASAATLLFFGTCIVALLYVYSQFGILSVNLIQKITSDRFNILGSAIFFVYLTMVLRVFFLLYCYHQKFYAPKFYIALFLMIFLMIMTGVRLNLFAVLIAIGLILTYRGRKFHYLLLMLAFPLVGTLSMFLRFFMRAHTHMNSMSELIQNEGGWSEIFLNPLELHYYQTLTSIITFDLSKRITRYPGEEVWVALTLPIPRSIFPLKGESASSVYSEVINPIAWVSAKSQATLGVFGVTLLEMGVVLGMVFIFLTGIAYSRLTLINANNRGIIPLITIFSLLVGTVIYHRSGITQFGQLVWPALFAAVVYKWLAFLISKTKRNCRGWGLDNESCTIKE